MVGRNLVKSWSRTQDSVTLSSADAELIVLGKLAAETLGVRSMMADLEMATSPGPSILFADASAALSIAKRDGAGKMRHINVRSLWLEEKAVRQALTYRKVKRGGQPHGRFDNARQTGAGRQICDKHRNKARQRSC